MLETAAVVILIVLFCIAVTFIARYAGVGVAAIVLMLTSCS